jgi:hypothetical protein
MGESTPGLIQPSSVLSFGLTGIAALIILVSGYLFWHDQILRHKVLLSHLAVGNVWQSPWSPRLVERYSRALKRLTGKQLNSPIFLIDISGYSPESAMSWGDDLYLNLMGVNRQFILRGRRKPHHC